MSLSSPPSPPHLSLCISPFSAFFFLSVFFLHASISFFLSEEIFLPLISIFLFALYIDEIGFFCSPMEDNHCSNCHLIAKFHSTVKGRNTGERAFKKNSNSFYLSISVSDLLSSSLLQSVISFSLCLSFLETGAKNSRVFKN